jgi:hypothetical protein
MKDILLSLLLLAVMVFVWLLIHRGEETIVYDPEMNYVKAWVDCGKRGGWVNTCGSPCEDESEICVGLCVNTCEFL